MKLLLTLLESKFGGQAGEVQGLIQALFRGQSGYRTVCQACQRESGKRGGVGQGIGGGAVRNHAVCAVLCCTARPPPNGRRTHQMLSCCHAVMPLPASMTERPPGWLPTCLPFLPAESSGRSDNFYEVDVPVKGHKSLQGEQGRLVVRQPSSQGLGLSLAWVVAAAVLS